jgi:hypothetical protein
VTAKPLDQARESSAERDRILASLVYASGLDKYLYRGRRGRTARKALAGVVDQRKLADAARSASIAAQAQSPTHEQSSAQIQSNDQVIDFMLDQLSQRLVRLLRHEFSHWSATGDGAGGHGGGGAGHGGHGDGGHGGGFDGGIGGHI